MTTVTCLAGHSLLPASSYATSHSLPIKPGAHTCRTGYFFFGCFAALGGKSLTYASDLSTQGLAVAAVNVGGRDT
jgi:hypothetical protein